VQRALAGIAEAAIAETRSQIGSGALPVSLLPSAALVLRPTGAGKSGAAVEALASALRHLPIPVIGRIEAGKIVLDLRCLEDEAGFIAQLDALAKYSRHPRGSGGPGAANEALQSLDSRFRGNDDKGADAGQLGSKS
jgi:L-seryl-tRNA selenium transferase